MKRLHDFIKKSVYWVAVKSAQVEWQNLYIGAAVYFSILVFSVALIFSKAFSYIGVALLMLFLMYCFVILFTVPISFGAIISQYFFRKKDVLNIYHILFGVLFMLVVMTLPFVGIIFFLLIYFYTFGIISRFAWYSL